MNAILRSLSIVVGIPTLVAAIYYGMFASDIYVSEARVAIRSANPTTSVSGIAAMLGSSVGGGSAQNSMLVADYARSLDMLQLIRSRIDIDAHYGGSDIDFLSRLESNPTNEELQNYFRSHVEFLRDSASDVLTLRVRAFDRQVAQDLAKLVIELSEVLVNKLSSRIEEDALQTAQSEMAIATEKVRLASSEMTRFQNENSSLNPAAESSAILGMAASIESKLIEARAELTEKRAFMRDDSAAVVKLKNRVNALSRQLRLEKGRVVGDTGKGEMNGLIEGFQTLVLEQEMAQQQYASALASLEVARIEALRKKQYLITFIQPSLPDQAIEPRRIKEVLTVMVFSFLFYLIGGLLWSALRDHMGH